MPPALAIPRSRWKPGGFTLIELLVVITVIAILAGILLPAIRGAVEASRKRTSMQVVAQVGMSLEQYNDTHGEYPPERSSLGSLYSSECLTVFLGRGLLSNETGLPATARNAIRAKRDFMAVKKTLVVDTDRNGYAEVVDAWGQPVLYNRTQFPTSTYAAWSYHDGASSAGRPLHNPKGYDLFSGNTYGVRVLGDPGKAGMSGYQTKALQKRASYTTEHHFRYPYQNEYVKYGRKLNTYLGNW